MAIMQRCRGKGGAVEQRIRDYWEDQGAVEGAETTLAVDCSSCTVRIWGIRGRE
jgi:hypothetical protein